MDDVCFPFISESKEETIAFGRQFADSLQRGDIVALQGELGAGKTHFVKGVAQGLGIEKNTVHSPTFSLINEYEGKWPLFHFDCYRLQSITEAIEIGAEEYFYGKGVCIIEWAERIASLLPPKTLWIELSATAPQKRQFIMRKRDR